MGTATVKQNEYGYSQHLLCYSSCYFRSVGTTKESLIRSEGARFDIGASGFGLGS